VFGLWTCVPELERPLPKAGLTLTITFAEGRVQSIAATAKGASKPRIAALEACADEVLFGLTLRDARDALSIDATFEPGARARSPDST
jgi:hypothetical protein